jgi:signal transduction histidine kinase
MSEAASATPTKSRFLPWLVLGMTLAILAGAILFSTLTLRRAMRQQIKQQDGITLYASSFVQPSLLDDLGPEIASDPELGFSARSEEMFETASKGGALALRLFDASGLLQMGLPLPAKTRRLTAEEFAAMQRFQPVSSFDPSADMRDFGIESLGAPVVRALIPLKAEGKLVGAAEFVLDGHKVASALRALDRDLWRSSLEVFAAAGVIIALSLALAYRRLNRINLLLSQRTQSLLRANHELMLAAKTSAIGAITAHLIHDLKNPLFGLQSFVQTRGSGDDEDWDNAAHAAERMQKLIAEVVRILQEEKTVEHYELSVPELFTLLKKKLAPEAEKAGVELVIGETFEETMLNRNANVISLVLTNLAQNAIQATGRGGQVTLNATRTAEGATFEVSDTGPGLPPSLLQNLFTPCRSTKSGGTGLGLAISKHLANHLGAELRLKQSSTEGSTFELRVSERVFASEPALS